MSDSTVLTALRSSLGIQSFPTYDIEFYKHTWTMRHTLPEESEFAWVMVNLADPPDQQRVFTYSTAMLSCGVCRIDNIPVYEVFGITSDSRIVDPNVPPIDVRRKAITALFNFFRQEVPNRVVLDLFTRYSKSVGLSDKVEEKAPESDTEGNPETGDKDPLL